MNKLEQAARQILEAVEGIGFVSDYWDEKITALREALAEQAEQEPVARYYGEKLVKGSRVFELIDRNLAPDTPLYAAPVRTKDLTDDEIQMLWVNWDANRKVEWYECIEDLIHIVEDYIKEKQADTNTDKGKNL